MSGMSIDAPVPPAQRCPRCGGFTRAAMVKTAIWREDRLFVVEDIPARVCTDCIEQFYDEDTTEALRRMTEDGFSCVTPEREISVPIFSLKDRIVRPVAPESSDDDALVDY